MIPDTYGRFGIRLSLILLAALLTLVAASCVSGLSLAQTGTAPFSLDPASTTLAVNDTVTISIKADASDQPVDTAQAVLNFDPNVLQVVDDNGNPATSIDSGPTLTSGTWRDQLLNSADNASGQIEFAAGKGSGGTDATTEFVLATIRFKGLSPSGSANVTFDAGSALNTKAFFQGIEVTGPVSNATLSVASLSCSPPGSGDWVVTQSCAFTGSASVPGNVVVENDVALTIAENASLDVDFSNHHLRIKNGARVIIKNGGKIN